MDWLSPRGHRKAVEYKSSKCRPPISSLHEGKNTINTDTEPQNTETWTGHSTYFTRMNSHICHLSPSFRVAIDWRRKGIERQPEAKKRIYTHPGNFVFESVWLRRSHSWITRDAIHVRSETEKNSMTNEPANVLESDSLVKLAIRLDQSPRNWNLRPNHFGPNPLTRGWSSIHWW